MTLTDLPPGDSSQAPRRNSLGRLIPWLVLLSLLFLLMPLYLISASLKQENDDLQAVVDASNEALERGPSIPNDQQKMQEQLSDTLDQVSAIEVVRSTLLKAQIDWPGVMAGIGNYNDNYMVLLGLAEMDGQVLLSGRAWDEKTVIDYAERLESAGYFDHVTVRSITTNVLPTPTPLPDATATPSGAATATPNPFAASRAGTRYVEFQILVQLKAAAS